MKKIYDITLTISNRLPVWPGNPSITLERMNKIEEGANSNVSRLVLGVHSGTHMDAPVHFLPGEKGIDEVSLELLIGPTQVVEFGDDVEHVDAFALRNANIAPGAKRVLFKTRNSKFWQEETPVFHKEYAGVTVDGAEFLVEKGIWLVGIDYLSIAPYKKSRPTHEVLLKAGIIAVEGLNLSGVPAGNYELICLPLKLEGSDGSPVRAVLIAGE